MTASILDQLRTHGLNVRWGEAGQLVLQGITEGPFLELAKAHKADLIAELRREADALYRCPHCHQLDYEPLRGPTQRHLRRCLSCGRRYRDHNDVRPTPPPAPSGCRLHRDDEGQPRLGYGGSLGCARHLRTLTASGRCPASGELVGDR